VDRSEEREEKVNRRQLKKARFKAVHWGLPEIMRRERSCAKLTSYERQVLAKEIKEFDTHVHESFRKACIDVLGEDPDVDWQ
jgi:hypothetical protein